MILFCLAAFMPCRSAAQVQREWVQRFNGNANSFDLPNSLKLDAASNAYVYGSSTSTGALTDIVLVKYNSSGSMLWSSLFNGYGNSVDQTNASYLDNAGNSYVTGFTADTGLVLKMVTLKYDSGGNLLWQSVLLPAGYQRSTGFSIVADAIGNVFTTGSIVNPNGTTDIILIKYSSVGSILDSVVYSTGSLNSESPVTILNDASGNLYVLGSAQQQGLNAEGIVIKFSPQLNFVWSKTLSGSSTLADMPVQLIMDNNGNLIACLSVNNTASGVDYGVFKLNGDSQILGEYFYNGIGNNQDIPYAVTVDNTNNIYVTGSSRSADTLGSEDIVTVKLNTSVQFQWSRAYNGVGRKIDYGTSITCDDKGSVYVGGASDKHDNHLAYALLKYNSAGDLLWFEQYSKIFYSEDFVYTVAVDNSYNVFVTGISFDSLSDYDIATIKYSQPIGITQIHNTVPYDFLLEQNYPNPFNPSTKIRFSIPYAEHTEIKIYNSAGVEVVSLLDEKLLPGVYEIDWDASHMASGIYFCSMRSGSYIKSMKMTLLK